MSPVVAVVLALLASVSVRGLSQLDFDSPGQQEMYKYRQALWKHSVDIAEFLADEVLDFSGGQLLMEEVEGIFADPEAQYLDCVGCRAFITAVRAVLDEGNNYWDVRDEVLEICYGLVNATEPGSNYEVLCPGTCDNYGPHVMYVLNTSTDTAYDICVLFNTCDPAVDPETTTEPPTEYQPRQGVKPKKKRVKRSSVKPNIDGALKLAYVTDIHVDPEYLEGTVTDCGLPICCRENYDGTGVADYWGDYECNIPPYTGELVLDFVASLEPDLLVYAGDTPPHAIWEETQWGQLNVSRWLAQEFEKRFLDIPAYSTVGNHETYPTNLYYISRPAIQEFNVEYASYWTALSGFTGEQLESFHKGAYFTIEVPNVPGLRVLSYNSNYGTTDNFYGPLLYDSDEFRDMQDFMENVLSQARANGEKILLLGHHPTGGGGVFIFFSRFITDIATRYGDIIILHLQGHSHSDNFRMTTDMETGEVFNVQISSASGTTRGHHNPSVRMIYVDPDTLVPLDYEQYILDLSKAIGNEEAPELELFYTASDAYNMTDLTPESYGDFVDRMEEDDELFDTYRFHEDTGTSTPGECDQSCRDQYFCRFRTTSYDDYRQCRNEA